MSNKKRIQILYKKKYKASFNRNVQVFDDFQYGYYFRLENIKRPKSSDMEHAFTYALQAMVNNNKSIYIFYDKGRGHSKTAFINDFIKKNELTQKVKNSQ